MFGVPGSECGALHQSRELRRQEANWGVGVAGGRSDVRLYTTKSGLKS